MDYEQVWEKLFVVTKTPLAGYNLSNIATLLVQNKFRISLAYIPRFLYSLAISSAMAPFRVYERKKFDKKIAQTEITHPPLFILGFWRSGTTYLHNVLSVDQNLGFFTTFQAYLPGVFLGGEKLFKSVVASSIPQKRPMDDVAMHPDFPQEDQYAVGAFSQYSYYHGWCFPKNMALYNRYVLMDGVSADDVQRWKDIYMYLLKKVTFAVGGKRLVLKNQDNTAKVKLLLELFPDAKFVLIQRNPYDIYYSMLKFMRIVIPLYCVQNPPLFSVVEDSMMELYADMFRKYLRERTLIPSGNLVEVKYEDFIREPMKIIEKIYTELHLEGFANSKESFDRYLKTQVSFNGESYLISDEVKDKLDKHWGFMFQDF